MSSGERVSIAGVPFPVRWLNEPTSWRATEDNLTVAAGPGTDWFVDPQQTSAPKLNAPALVGVARGDFQLSACVTVDFAGTYDAGVLMLYADDRSWAKLCFEYSPQREPMVVSVVTRGLSDDCNSFVVDGLSVRLRVARLGTAFAFHASTDGGTWSLVRHFALEPGSEPAVGFAAQAPTGDGCRVTFEQIAYEAVRLVDLRSG